MENSVDPVQEQSDLSLYCLPMPFCKNFSVQNFRTFTITKPQKWDLTVHVFIKNTILP